MSRNYSLSPEARQQRSEAAKARWAALSKEERTEALRPAFTVTPGNTSKRKPKSRRYAVRDAATGKFTKILS